MEDHVQKAKDHFESLVKAQLKRIEEMKKGADWIDYSTLRPIIIGVAGGDGIGPEITRHAETILKFLLTDEIQNGKIQLKDIIGLTIENRAKVMKAIPDDVLDQLKSCNIILKGPCYTPSSQDLASGKWPNLESANVSMRRELDLFANVRPVKVPDKGIDWMFFRENTEGAYVLGSKGIKVTNDLAFDFCVHTLQGTDRILRLAFDYAKKTGVNRVSLVTKANVVKTTDGMYLNMAKQLAKEEYPEIKFDEKIFNSDFFNEMEDSKRFLELEDNWDDLGSKSYKLETWIKMKDFLIKIIKDFYNHSSLILPTPYINPGKGGAFDLHWKTEHFEILLRIPEEDEVPISFYGDNYKEIKIRGTLEVSKLEALIEWIRLYY